MDELIKAWPFLGLDKEMKSEEISTQRKTRSSEDFVAESFISKKNFRNKNKNKNNHHLLEDERNPFWNKNPKPIETNSFNCSQNLQQQNVLAKIIKGSETGINEFPW